MPLEQVSNPVTFYAMYVASKVGKTGLTVTVDVYRVNTSATATQVVTGASATEVGGGLYLYQLASGTVTVEGEYVALFKTADTTVDVRHIPAIWAVQKAGTEYLDAAVSTRLSTGGGSTSYAVTVTRPDGTTPISGASVWVTTDSAGGNVIAGTLTTNGSGVATFMLDAGSYYLWRQAEGWNFANPTAITVS